MEVIVKSEKKIAFLIFFCSVRKRYVNLITLSFLTCQPDSLIDTRLPFVLIKAIHVKNIGEQQKVAVGHNNRAVVLTSL